MIPVFTRINGKLARWQVPADDPEEAIEMVCAELRSVLTPSEQLQSRAIFALIERPKEPS